MSISSHLWSKWPHHDEVNTYPSDLHNTHEYKGKNLELAPECGSQRKLLFHHPLASMPDCLVHRFRHRGWEETQLLQKGSRWTLHSMNSQSHTRPAGVWAKYAYCGDSQQRKFLSCLFTTEEADERKGGSWSMSTQSEFDIARPFWPIKTLCRQTGGGGIPSSLSWRWRTA